MRGRRHRVQSTARRFPPNDGVQFDGRVHCQPHHAASSSKESGRIRSLSRERAIHRAAFSRLKYPSLRAIAGSNCGSCRAIRPGPGPMASDRVLSGSWVGHGAKGNSTWVNVNREIKLSCPLCCGDGFAAHNACFGGVPAKSECLSDV